MIEARCPHCGADCFAEDAAAGSAVTCLKCGRPMRLPDSPRPTRRATPEAPDAIPDEDAAVVQRSLPAPLPAEAQQLGRPRFRIEKPPLPQDAFKPAFFAFVGCIPSSLCIVGSEHLLGKLVGISVILGLVSFAVWWIRRQLFRSWIYTTVFENGFLVKEPGALSIWTWDDVAALNFQNVDMRTYVYFIQTQRFSTTYYKLRHRNGARLEFWSTRGPRAAQFGRMALDETLQRMLPDIRAKLQAGRTVDFGPLRADREGLTFRGRTARWSELGPIELSQGNVIIPGLGPDGGSARISLDAIDNGHVLLTILEEKTEGNARRG